MSMSGAMGGRGVDGASEGSSTDGSTGVSGVDGAIAADGTPVMTGAAGMTGANGVGVAGSVMGGSDGAGTGAGVCARAELKAIAVKSARIFARDMWMLIRLKDLLRLS